MNKFEINSKGFAELQAGRPKWSFVRELISNAFDEKITICNVTITKEGRKPAVIVVEDDGEGFRDLRDAYTLFAPTPKRSDPSVRGRFNLGEKEFAAIAKEMRIDTTTGGVHFIDGKRKRINKKREKGTVVTVRVNWSQSDIEEIDKMIRLIIVPDGVTFYYLKNTSSENESVIITSPGWIDSTEAKLRTTLFSSGAMRPTTRTTVVDVYELHDEQESGWIHELGIPIQMIDCPYNIDVNQKVPMNANRDTVSDYYLKDIYALTLNMTADRLDENDVSDTWVHTATEDELANEQTIKTVHDKRYKDAVLWSSDATANERAREDGKEIIHSRYLSAAEKNRFKTVGLVSASVNYGTSAIAADSILYKDWTDGMSKLNRLVEWMGQMLCGVGIVVRYIDEPRISSEASYANSTITFNLAKFGRKNTEPPYGSTVIGMIIHELAHRRGHEHYDKAYLNELYRLAGEAVVLALDDQETFNRKTGR